MKRVKKVLKRIYFFLNKSLRIYYFNCRVKSFEVGAKVDVRDPTYIWCVGTIQKIIQIC